MEIILNGGSLVWLRRDLRLEDNNAISKAISLNTKFILCFVFDKKILNPLLSEPFAVRDTNNFIIDNRISFIYYSLKELDKKLKKIGSGLIVKYGFSTKVIPELARKLQVENVIFSNDYEPLSISRDTKIREVLKQENFKLYSVKDQCVFEKTEILSKTSTPYTVFTPYKKVWFEKFFSSYPFETYQKKQLIKHICTLPVSNFFPFPKLEIMGFSSTNSLPPNLMVGSSGARYSINQFLSKVDSYKSKRDFPALGGTSCLSVHLRFGTISVREIIQKILGNSKNFIALSEGQETWLSELVWREFYMQILFNFPHVVSGSFKKHFDSIQWASSKLLFDSWCSGQTGYPIIDAGMRELNETGFMHNRLRMLTASFLTKDFGINWQEGEKYFALKLIDFDLSANNGGWQWAASTGCDAQPYFRIFNPITQSKKFDPEGKYIKKYVPELTNLSKKFIHTPWLAPDDILDDAGIKMDFNYPTPKIEHSSARLSTLKRYEAAKFKI